MSKNKHRVVMLLIGAEHGHTRKLLKGIAKYSNLHGPWTFYRKPPFYRNLNKFIREFDKNLQVDGIIAHSFDYNKIKSIVSKGIPIVINLTKNIISNIPNMIADDAAIGKIAAQYFLDKGFKNFAYCGYDDMLWSNQRMKSFVMAIAQAGFQISIYEEPNALKARNLEQGQKILNDWLKNLPKPSGLFTCNDDRAQDIFEACKMIDLHIPDEVSILGVDNDETLCELMNPPLSSIELNSELAGYEAAEMLDKMISTKQRCSVKNISIKPVYVVERQSTNILAINDIEVRNAMRFIHDNSKQLIQVEDVVLATSLSRRALEERFNKVIGKSILNEIDHLRIQHICRILLETDWPISKIALSLGYSNTESIFRYFKKHVGITPLKYRSEYRCK